jgi:hypothetical protein
MKAIQNYLKIYVLAIAIFAIAACKKENKQNTAAPTLNSVSNLVNRSTDLQAVNYGDWILLKGTNLSTTQKVDFNGTLAADSLIYAEDNSITVKIPSNLVDPINNPITVTTKYGSATLNFQIKQPNPLVDDFTPAAGGPDDEVTIVGNYFKGVSGVTINGVAATIVSSTQTQIKVKVPTGVTYGPVVVTTPVGSVTAAKTFGLKHVIFDDALRNVWTNTSYSLNSIDFASTVEIRRGTAAIAVNAKGWGAMRYRLVSKFNTAGYTMLKISIYGKTVGSQDRKVKISVTPAAGSYEIKINEGRWTDYQIPLANIGNPATIEYITFQEFSGKVTETYVDDIGFY